MDHLDTQMSDQIGSQQVSRATSPGGYWRDVKDVRVYQVNGRDMDNGDASLTTEEDEDGRAPRPVRYRPRTFPYRRYLPYRTDDHQYENLDKILKKLYVAVSAGDFIPGATHWTRELRGWMQLKFDLPRADRVKLIKLYYELALAPGMDHNAGERFASMFMHLTKRKHYLKPGEDLTLDWRPLYREFKSVVLPQDTNTVVPIAGNQSRRGPKTLLKLCTFAQVYFDPQELPQLFEELLPYFSASNPETGFAVIGLLNAFMPTGPPAHDSKYQPSFYLPTLFHLWSLLARSKSADVHFIDLFSRLARDSLVSSRIPFSQFGIFSSEQSSTIFTAILKLLEIPVGQVMSPYSQHVEAYMGMAMTLERDQRKHPVAHNVARWIVMSLSPHCAEEKDSVLSQLEGLIQATETFFHPSNTGNWTKTLSQLIFYLSDFFVMRWNRERSGEMAVPEERRLNDAVKRRFVVCLRDVVFMGIFAKSGTAITYSLSALGSLAFLEPSLVLPGALQRIYPALKGLVEVHRTTSAIRALKELTRPMARSKGFRCHIPALLGLALPGIDANDLDKTLHTLAFMQAVFYEVPMVDLTKQPLDFGGYVNVKEWNGHDDESEASDHLDGMLATQWITYQIERLETESADIEINYDQELTDKEESAIARSCTADFPLFMSSFMERVITLMRNMPDAARQRSGSPEENVANTLPATCTPLFSSMSTDLYEQTLNNLAAYVEKHVDYQARDAMAFIISSLTKVDAKKALSKLVPILCRNIRVEIDDNGAGTTRTAGSEVMPGDKALIWNITLLSMSVVNSGSAAVDFAEELMDIATFTREKCKGIPATHASNLIHHILLTITNTYTLDHALFEEAELATLTDPTSLWAQKQDPSQLNIKWHFPGEREIDFAVKVFQTFATREIARIDELTGAQPPVKRDGTGKEWSDELSRSLVLLRLMISGASALFDSRREDQSWTSVSVSNGDVDEKDISDDSEEVEDAEPNDADYGATEDEDVRQGFYYPSGYPLKVGDKHYETMHSLRMKIGETLHKAHNFLVAKQEDDVTSFNALYTAYRSWFTDVGIERSAHVLDRVTRLFVADINQFKTSGIRKDYPRPLLVRRANVYHLQRLRHDASARPRTELDTILLKDLVQSSVSRYTDIRRTAQTAIESSMKVIIGARPVLIPPLLKHLEEAIPQNDFPVIKGAIYSLLFGNLVKPIGRDWRFTPRLMKCYVNVLDVDRPSVQRLSTGAAIQIMDMTRQFSRMVIMDQSHVESIKPDFNAEEDEKLATTIKRRETVIQKRRDFVKSRRKQLADELAETAQSSHWRKESRTATLVIGLSLRFDDIASETMIDLVVKRAVDPHPSLRMIYSSSLIGLFTFIDTRAIADHKYENLLLEKRKIPGFVRLTPERDSPDWTSKFLTQFAQPEADVYIDQDYPGWLVWGESIPAFQASSKNLPDYDEVEQNVRKHIGRLLDKEWFSKYIAFMKQEPRDQNHDRFHMSNVLSLASCFGLVFSGLTPTKLEDIRELIKETFGDGTDKHGHRATTEVLAALLSVSRYLEPSQKTEIWEFVFPIVRNMCSEEIKPENLDYWTACIDCIVGADPRRTWPLIEWLSSFRLDMSSNAAFKESSRINLLEHAVLDIGWHFQLDKPVVEDFLAHLDHPYKGVREAMAFVLNQIDRTRVHESYKNVPTLVEAQYSAGPLGLQPYRTDAKYEAMIKSMFAQIKEWQAARAPGQQEASSYTSGGKTITLFLEKIIESYECSKLIPFFHGVFLEPILQMMDVKEDPELQIGAYSLFRGLGVVPFRSGEEADFVEALMRVGRTSSSWHARLRSMVNMQAIYYCQLFLMSKARKLQMFECIADMLEDTQLEVRIGAAATLSGMIRCSPVAMRESVIKSLNKKFTEMLQKNPLPRRSGPGGTPTPDQNKIVLTRHAAVLGLGGLVEAFPYASPPPEWVPEILATLASRAAGDPGMVGKSAKETVSDFKKTRQDTWHIDVKAFTSDQLESLEGVLWKSYFA